jgi:hypothetical protein
LIKGNAIGYENVWRSGGIAPYILWHLVKVSVQFNATVTLTPLVLNRFLKKLLVLQQFILSAINKH